MVTDVRASGCPGIDGHNDTMLEFKGKGGRTMCKFYFEVTFV